MDDPIDRRGARFKFRFRTRSAGMRADVGDWKNREESRVCGVWCVVRENTKVWNRS